MKKSTLAALGIAAALALTACQNNQDEVTNVDANATDLNMLADNAAIEANEMDTLGNQQNQLENEANATEPTDNLANQAEADAAVNGM
jgi:CO dehydrogenase nickel-insertion accessory protein CooC1